MTFCKKVTGNWLGYLINGPKTYEGRIFREDWAKIRPGDEIIFYNEEFGKHLFRIVACPRFTDFAQAYQELGEELIPDSMLVSGSAVETYRQIFTSERDYADLVQNGMVAVKVEYLREV